MMGYAVLIVSLVLFVCAIIWLPEEASCSEDNAHDWFRTTEGGYVCGKCGARMKHIHETR